MTTEQVKRTADTALLKVYAGQAERASSRLLEQTESGDIKQMRVALQVLDSLVRKYRVELHRVERE